jgi:DNA-binding response OmpR family regulator/REP element-mobilizing transposase RayT
VLKKILAASPQPAFGELLRLSLEKGSDYQVHLARNGGEVLSAISRDNYDLAILDAELKDQPFVPLIQNLHVQQPQMRIVVIPQTAGITRHSLKAVSVDGFLEKPININDLQQVVKNLTADLGDLPDRVVLPKISITETKDPIEAKWIGDYDLVQQNLFRLASRSAAQAVFVMQDRLVWAQASRESAVFNHQVIDLFVRAWDRKTHLDLVKVFREGPDKTTWLLYATSLIHNYILIMIFDAQIPMHKIRGHVIRMANGLSNASLFENHGDDEAVFFDLLKENDVAESDQNPSEIRNIGGVKPPPLPTEFFEEQPKAELHRITCVLVPRLKQNQLVGDLKESLKVWIPQICQTNEWQLEEMIVRPDHVQCAIDFSDKNLEVTVPQTLRQKLSEMIFKLFPAYQAQGEFWVENILFTTEKQQLSNAALRNYIRQVQSGS